MFQKYTQLVNWKHDGQLGRKSDFGEEKQHLKMDFAEEMGGEKC